MEGKGTMSFISYILYQDSELADSNLLIHKYDKKIFEDLTGPAGKNC